MKTQRVTKGRLRKRRLAVLNRTVRGRFTTWRKGMTVLVAWLAGRSYSIERRKWRGKLHILNALAGVPRSAFDFIDG